MAPPPRNASYAFATPRAQQQSGIPARPAMPHIHVPQRPPVAAFATSPINEKASSLSPASPFSKGSALSDEDDRYGSVVGGNPNMDFWKRFSMTLHDKEMEDQGVKPKQNWLNKQFEGKRKYKVIIWAVACLIIIAIAAALAWHFTHNDSNSEKAPTQHDFGLGPGSSSANPLATVSVDKGTAKRSAMPLEPHRMRRRAKRAPLPAGKRDLPVQAQARLQRAIFNRPHA